MAQEGMKKPSTCHPERSEGSAFRLREHHPHGLQLPGEGVQNQTELLEGDRSQKRLIVLLSEEHGGRSFPLGNRDAAL